MPISSKLNKNFPSGPETLYACIRISQLPAQTILAGNPHLISQPFVVIEQDEMDHKTLVLAVSFSLRGVHPGMPVYLAKKRVRKLQIYRRDKSKEELLWSNLKEIGLSFTPFIHLHRVGLLTLDLGHTPLFRQYRENFYEMGVALQEHLKKKTGVIAAIGISCSSLLAQILAKKARPQKVLICNMGEEKSVMSTMEVEALEGLSGLTRDKLKKFGIKHLGQLQGISKKEIEVRFGGEGEKLYALAAGLSFGFSPLPKKVPIYAEVSLSKDVNEKDSLNSMVLMVVDQFCFALQKESILVNKILLYIIYTDGKKAQRTLSLSRETRDFKTILQLVSEAFFSLYQRRVALKKIQLTVLRMKERGSQLDLLISEEQEKQEKIAHSLFKIRNRHHFTAIQTAGGVRDFKKENGN